MFREMEKLIELLNEYEIPQSGVVFKSYDNYDGTFYGVDCDGETEIAWSDSLIISKKYGFIKWLVENEKIDREQKTKEFRLQIELDNGSYGELGGEARLLMLLSIQDEPIEFLVSILK